MPRLTQDQWASVRADWSTGRYTLAELGEKYGVSHTAIRKRIKKEGWQQMDGELVASFVEKKVAIAQEIEKVSEVSKFQPEKLEAAIDELVRFEMESAARMQAIDDEAFSRLDEASVAELKAMMDIHIKRREALLGKRPDTAIQINQAAPTAVEVVFVEPGKD